MKRLSKYIGIYILENKFELEELLNKIDLVKAKMPHYIWIDDIDANEIVEAYCRYFNTDIMVVDSILHHLHLNDPTLREHTYIFVAYYKNKYINFFTGLMTPKNNFKTKKAIKTILDTNYINFNNIQIHHTSDNNPNLNSNIISNEAVYISFLSIEDEIDRQRIKQLYTIFPNGYLEGDEESLE